MSLLVQKRAELRAKQGRLAQIFEEAGTDINLSRVTCISGTNEQKRAEIKRLSDELEVINSQAQNLALQEKASTPVGSYPLPGGGGSGFTGESIGAAFVKSNAYAGRIKGGKGPTAKLGVNVKDFLNGMESKAVMSETYPAGGTGWVPQAIRTGTVVPFALRPVQVLDMLPVYETQQAAVVYMEETTATNASAETGEGVIYPQDTLIFTERNVIVRKIASYLPITDEQLDDVPQVAGYVDGRLRFFVRQRLDGQVVAGDGTGQNLLGIVNVAGIQTQAKGADPGPDAIYKAIINKVNLVGRATASAVIMHPTDWLNLRLLKTADGEYLFGKPNDATPPAIWGLPVVLSDAGAQGTAIAADFQNFTALYMRTEVETSVGFVNDDFAKGQKSIRADVRSAFVVLRPAAVCKITGL